MATPPRIQDPQCQAAFLARAFVLSIPGVGNGYLIPVLGVPTQDDAIGHPTIFMRLDPAGADSLLYFDPTGTGADIIPVGNEEGEVVANNTGGNFAAGDLVYLPTWDATNGMREAVLADSDTPAKQATHVCTEAIATGATGTVSGRWVQRNVNTSAYSAADVKLYLTTTGTTGNTSSETIPTAKTDIGQEVGMVATKHATTGVIVWYPGAALVQKHGNASLQANTLSADATGRALMEADFFDAATLAAKIVLARGAVLRGNATDGAEAASIAALGAILAGDGTDAAVVNLLTAALGGTGFALRSYAGGALQEPAEDATLTAALGSLMLLRRDAMARLLLDDATPSATAGRGLVVSGSGVTAQAAPDATVIVASGVAYNQQGRRVLCTTTPVLAVTDPNPLGGVRNDIVVIPAAGGAPVVREGAIIATDPVLTAGDVPLARLRCPNGAVTITGAEIDDLRQTAESVAADKILSGYPARYVAGSVAAPVPAAGTVALTPNAFNTLTPAGAGAYNLDNMTGLDEGQHAFVCIDNGANPATIRDNAVGGGAIWTRRAASIVLADVHDAALVVCRNARYHVFGHVIQAGQASGTPSANDTASTTIRKLENLGALAASGVNFIAPYNGGAGAIDDAVGPWADFLPTRTVQILGNAALLATTWTIDGTDMAGNPVSDSINHPGGAVIAQGDVAMRITRVRSDIDPGAGATATVETGDGFGLSSAFTAALVSVDGVVEAPAVSDGATGTIIPTSVPNAARVYVVRHGTGHAHGPGAHTHLT